MTEEVKQKKTRRVYIECVVVRKLGVGAANSDQPENRMAEVGELIKLTKESARRLQDVGAIKVSI